MTSCYFCGKLEYIPFKCRRCGHSFCTDHRLPEYHYCESVRKPSSPFQPTPPPREQTPTPTIYQINVHSKPTLAEVYFNNTYFGLTPTTVNINKGTYAIKIIKSGYYDFIQSVKISSGLTLNADLVIITQPLPPSISQLSSTIKLITVVYNRIKISIQSISTKLSIILTKRILLYKIKIAMRSDKIEYIKIDYIAANLSAYIRHCYLNNFINDKYIDENQKNFDKLTKLIALTESDNVHESNAAKDKALKLCKQMFYDINMELDK